MKITILLNCVIPTLLQNLTEDVGQDDHQTGI